MIQVFTGKEEKMRRACLKYVDPDVLEDTFIPKRIRRRKYSGVWKDEECALFPGYVFMITSKPQELYDQLWRVEGLTKLLHVEKQILTLTDSEVEFMKRLGGKEHIAQMSIGFIVGDKVTVTDGPLKGLEGMIKKIDRHKRQCIVETDMFGQKTKMIVGIEIVSKE
ncbi:MAG: antiterminator LoaP [Clostridiales bacterium]|nr:antiterminator LoaP [Clostridiales bacterium]